MWGERGGLGCGVITRSKAAYRDSSSALQPVIVEIQVNQQIFMFIDSNQHCRSCSAAAAKLKLTLLQEGKGEFSTGLPGKSSL